MQSHKTGSDLRLALMRIADSALIGAYGSDEHGNHSGSAYMFERNEHGGWPLIQKVMASDAAKGDFFGHSVSVDNETLLVGAYGNDVEDYHYGSAYIFRNNTGWSEEKKLKLRHK